MSDVTSSMIIDAFDSLKGDMDSAREAAGEFDTAEGWATWQATQAATVGAAAAAIPVAHLAGLAADVAILIHKMAYCSAGIGFIHGADVDIKNDMPYILGIWSGDIKDDAIGTTIVGGSVGGSAYMIASDPATAGKVAGKGIGKVAGKKLGPTGGKLVGKASSIYLKKIAPKIAQKIGAKMATKSLTGFLPVVGSVVGGGINAWFIKRIYDSADRYYKIKATL